MAKNIDSKPSKETSVTPKALSSDVLAAAKRAFPQTVAAQKAALAADRAADAAREAGEAASKAAGQIERRTVLIHAASPGRAHLRRFNAERKAQYLELLAQAVTPTHAAKAIGITTATIKKHMHEDPEFGLAVRTARADATAPIIEAMWDVALMGNFLAQKYLLENMDPENWRDPKTIKVEVSGQIEDAGQNADRVGRIKALEARLAERLALRAAGDQIEDDIADAEILEKGQIEDAAVIDEKGQIEDAGEQRDFDDEDRLADDEDEAYGARDFRRDVGF